MSARAVVVRWSVVAALILLAAARADAQTQPCAKDTDCPGTECGSQVCVMSSGLAFCYPANTQGASGLNDGWCAASDGTAQNSNCKCASMGATCEGFFCSFTIPPGGTGGGGGGSGGGGGGGATGTGGSGTGTGGSGGGDSGCSVAGAPSSSGLAAGLGLLAAALIGRRARRRS
jgi:MYXO-CTERM domain-containing protein